MLACMEPYSTDTANTMPGVPWVGSGAGSHVGGQDVGGGGGRDSCVSVAKNRGAWTGLAVSAVTSGGSKITLFRLQRLSLRLALSMIIFTAVSIVFCMHGSRWHFAAFAA